MSKLTGKRSEKQVQETIVKQANKLNDVKNNMDNIAKSAVISDLPISQVIETLTRGIINTATYNPSYDWILTNWFKPFEVFDGLKDYNYIEYITGDTGSPYDDFDSDDLNRSNNKAIRLTFLADEEFNKKTSVLDEELINFKRTPGDAIRQAFKNIKNLEKADGKDWERKDWEKLEERKFDITIGLKVDGQSPKNDKIIYKTLLDFGTTSKNHKGVGQLGNGIIKDITNLNQVQPSLKFNTNEFYMIISSEYEANITYDGDRAFFNWGAKQIQLAGVKILNFTEYEVIKEIIADTSTTEYDNLAVIAIHKSAIENIFDWSSTKVSDIIGRMYSNIYYFRTKEVVKIETSPILWFKYGAIVKKGSNK